MKIRLKPIAAALCIAGLIAPVLAQAAVTNGSDNAQANAAQMKSLQNEVAELRNEMNSLKQTKKTYKKSRNTHQATHTTGTGNVAASDSTQSHQMSRSDFIQMFNGEEYLPFDPDVPGKAFVSTGPYVGVPIQFAGSNLIVNSPSVNTDVQLLGIRKSIVKRLNEMGAEITKEQAHSHLLLSGVVEADAGYLNSETDRDKTSIDLSTVSLDAFFLGPSDWTLGFIELSYVASSPAEDVFVSSNNYRVANSRVFVNKAFITIGNFSQSPFYGSAGQFYVPFGTYSSVMISEPLTKILTRTKARAVLLGFQQQDPNAFYGSAYIFPGYSHTGSSGNINNGGLNLGYKFNRGFFTGNVGGGVIATITDSGGMQLGNNFAGGNSPTTGVSLERISHRVPGYNLRALLSFGEHIDVIAEYVGAMTRFSASDMQYQGRGAKPYAFDTEGSYSFMIMDNKPSSVGIGYSRSRQALALGIPLNRYYAVFNTSLWRNTLQSLEFRRDQEYAESDTAVNAGNVPAARENGLHDNAVTAQFDYYF